MFVGVSVLVCAFAGRQDKAVQVVAQEVLMRRLAGSTMTSGELKEITTILEPYKTRYMYSHYASIMYVRNYVSGVMNVKIVFCCLVDRIQGVRLFGPG